MPPKPAAKPAKQLTDKELREMEKEKERHEQETQLSMMIASTFANNELESKKQTLAQYCNLAQKLKDENARLREEMLERDRDSLQVVEFLRREVEKKQETIESLKNQLDDQKEKANDLLMEKESGLQEVIRGKDALIEDKEAEIRRLEDELESVATHKREKHEMEYCIESLRKELSVTKEKYERELSRLRFQSLEEKVRLKSEEKDLTDRFSQAVNLKAMDLLDGQTRKIHAENIELRENHHKLEQEYMLLSKQSKLAEEERKVKEREIELCKQSVEEYSKQGYRAHKEIRDLTQRCRQLEQNMTKVVQQYEKERKKTLDESQKEVEVLNQSLKETTHALEIRSMELHRIRRLARVILQQRSELEVFFTEALDYVRAQIIQERKAAEKKQEISGFAKGNFQPIMQEGKDGTLQSQDALPPLPGTSGSAASDKASGTAEHVDISDLSWQDKERVLRILFAKINSAQSSRKQKRALAQSQSPQLLEDRPDSTFVTQSQR